VTSGIINKHRNNRPDMSFLATYRTTGESEPSHAQMLIEGVEMFKNSTQETIVSDYAVDIYISCGNADADSNDWGEVIVWA
jgi:hypothetical protein